MKWNIKGLTQYLDTCFLLSVIISESPHSYYLLFWYIFQNKRVRGKTINIFWLVVKREKLRKALLFFSQDVLGLEEDLNLDVHKSQVFKSQGHSLFCLKGLILVAFKGGTDQETDLIEFLSTSKECINGLITLPEII
ncbi:hypothetical protein LOTGIDRAFT_153651 [Lottia gigantea]|uniref:Uncharacterized protein n=1 Tax=Lottia gigantea TaxID=225164 RepID=V4AD13_LOTGI|nr:hypothetical protein LOTGIDRAFT_153651 [Lottia gigantea]ESO91221.1 hypothetical protein LOTGIDRAFT_153651 [Lottia gigantea]